MKKTVVRPGRTISGTRKVPIHVSGLKIGMDVIELDRPWLETPFVLQGFTIESLDQIETISQYCEYVYIDEKNDQWLAAEERATLQPRGGNRHYEPLTTNRQEFRAARSIHNSGRRLTRSFMEDVRLGRAIDIQAVEETVSETVSSVIRNANAMLWLSRIRNADEYTSEHSLNVALLAINFGRHLGFGVDELNKLGLCAMLHDVGKMRTPTEILNKPGALSADEFLIMQAHPTHGRDILMAHKDIYHGAIDVAYSHHETLDGSGYPRKIKSTGLSDFTRIVTICDVYDAITSDRVYKAGQSSHRALKILYNGRGERYDERLVTEFIECIGLYPPGTLVELHSGDIGIVISTNYRNRHLPKVLMVLDTDKNPAQETVLNLATEAAQDHSNRLIREVLPNGKYDIRIEKYIERGLMLS